MSDQRLTHVLIREWPEVRGLTVIAGRTIAAPYNVSVGLDGGPCGLDDITDIDGTEPGARAKAVSLGDMLHAMLVAAELGWFTPEDEIDVTKR